MAEKAFYTTLKNRGIVKISGPDARPFLQGLISNDINLLDSQPMIYACLLNAQGKFLHDFFITEKNGVIIMDCEGGERALNLFRKLSMYKLRANIKIECEENVPVYVGVGNAGTPDPRHPDMGFRSFEKPELPEQPFDTWDRRRIFLTVPDGSRDLIPEKSTLDEGRIDTLNGVSYDKGCYIGQELTARMHYRGLGKKHLYTVHMNALPENAELRSSCDDLAIALLKDVP